MSTPRKRPATNTGRVAVFARREAIEKALDEGRFLNEIYAEHAADLGISYTQFTRHVKRYIRKEPNVSPTPVPSAPIVDPAPRPERVVRERPQKPPSTSPRSVPKPAGAEPGGRRPGFHHNPSGGSDPDDPLI